MRLTKINVGADPELFIINTKTKKVVSAIGLIPGTKEEPYRANDMPKGFGLQTDNILAEFNIPPATCKDEFVSNILFMQDYIDKYVKNIYPDLGIKCAASQIVPNSELQSDQAKQFGCSIDYNVYTQAPNEKPCGETTNIRSCGLHLHIGYDIPNIDTSLKFIKYLDAYIGVPSVIKDKDTKRRSLYGKAGCFRLKPYGFEYRTLSGAMMNSTARLKFVWEQLEKAVSAIKAELPLPLSDAVQNAINNSDIELAKELMSTYKLV